MKNNIDSGVFTAVQVAGIEALENGDAFVEGMREIYKKRRSIAIEELSRLGYEFEVPKGTFYVWIKIPKGYDSKGFASFLLEKTGVVVAPGRGYGEYGEGYIRISLTIGEARLKEAFQRIGAI